MSNFDETMLNRLKSLEREVERLKLKQSPGAWLDWTPTVAWSIGTEPTSTVVVSARYCKIGKLVNYNIYLAITRGTGTAVVCEVTAPTAAPIVGGATAGYGRQTLTNATPTVVAIGVSSTIGIRAYIPSTPTQDGYLIMSGTYETP